MNDTATVKVTGETYRVSGRDYNSVLEAAMAVYKHFGEEPGADSAEILRITHHEPVHTDIMGDITETMTGRLSIEGPQRIVHNAELSRYNPVNGWDIPDRIAIRVSAFGTEAAK